MGPNGWSVMKEDQFTTGSTEAHNFVFQGDVRGLESILDIHAVANAKDDNGWTPLHEAVRLQGNKEMISLLLDRGADINSRVYDGRSILAVAKDFLTGKDPETLQFLE